MIDVSYYIGKLERLKWQIEFDVSIRVNYEINIKPMLSLMDYFRQQLISQLGIREDRIGEAVSTSDTHFVQRLFK